jgi:flavin reductase (DIM6/NTAB) family NADH-FMN oxidoreductase RutF
VKPLYEKVDLPVASIRRYLEPGPIVLVSSALADRRNVMTMGWHTVIEFSPSLIGCVISRNNHSFGMVRDSGECVINIPSSALAEEIVGIGKCSGAWIDKFETFKLTTEPASMVKAPLIRECFANLECRLVDDSLVEKYSFFVFEVVKAHVATTPEYPETLHYMGDGTFMVSGKVIEQHPKFSAGILWRRVLNALRPVQRA